MRTSDFLGKFFALDIHVFHIYLAPGSRFPIIDARPHYRYIIPKLLTLENKTFMSLFKELIILLTFLVPGGIVSIV